MMQGREPERAEVGKIYRDLFSDKVEPIRYRTHPSEDVLQSYLLGKLQTGWNEPDVQIAAIQEDDAEIDWTRNEVTAHLITCPDCQGAIESLRTSVATSPSFVDLVGNFLSEVRERVAHVPRPALATIGLQAVIIVVLGVFLATSSLPFGIGAASLGEMNGRTNGTLPEPQRAIGSATNASDWVAAFDRANERDRNEMAQDLVKNLDSELVQAIPQVMPEVDNDETLRLLSQAFNEWIAAINDTLTTTVDQFEQYRRESDNLSDEMFNFPDPNLLDELQHSMAELQRSLRKLQISADLDVLSCNSTTGMINLGALDPVLDENAAVLIYDTKTENSFEVQLPPLFRDRAIAQLQNAGLACVL